ncbi:MAG: hypothetical protein ACP5K9_03015 [Candidatus Micrarchaeia archaeon]
MERAQSAMEYLMTYGWALLIIAIVFATLVASGVFSPNAFVTPSCTLPSGLSCSNFFLYSNGTLSVQIVNSMQDPMNITAVGCAQASGVITMQPPYNPPSNQVYVASGSGSYVSIICSPTALSPGTLFTGNIKINYTDDITGFQQTAPGKIVAKVN